ncbi:GNAT family N-acetyltransferase [bacterium]|nr:GNAT family N-acetyltransferase [bacterium]
MLNKSKGHSRKITDDEFALWIACPKEKGDEGYNKWIEDEKKWFSQNKIPIKNLFIYEEDGKFPGKLCFCLSSEEKSYIVFPAPAIKAGSDIKTIAINLFNFAIEEGKKRGTKNLFAFLDDHNNHIDILKEAYIEAGFCDNEHKFLFSRELDSDLIPFKDEKLEFVTGKFFKEDYIKELFKRSLPGSLDHAGCPFLPDLDEDFQTIKGATNDDFLIAFLDKEPVGFSSLCLISKDKGTLGYICVLPESRGRGYGDIIFAESLNRFRQKGVKEYLGSTNVKNYPMIEIFKRNGCVQKYYRIEFTYMIK